MAKNFLNTPGLPLGLRNNNPGDLRASDDHWLGMTGTNQGFVVFQNCSWGLRALAIDLRSKINAGFNTLEKIIYRFAPPNENNTEAYLDYMIGATLFSRTQILSATDDTLLKLMKGIVQVEIGMDYFYKLSDADFNEGIAWMHNAPGQVTTGQAATAFGGSIVLFLAVLYLVTRPNNPKRTKSTRTRAFKYL